MKYFIAILVCFVEFVVWSTVMILVFDRDSDDMSIYEMGMYAAIMIATWKVMINKKKG